MGAIIIRQKVMYWSPTRNRHYASLRQAALAEAGSQVSEKYPQEEGWHWTQDDRLTIARARLARRLEAAARLAAQDME